MDSSEKAIALYKEGQPVDLSNHPSLVALFHAQNRVIQQIDGQIQDLEDQIEELTERIAIHKAIEMPTRGLKATRTRRRNRVKQLRQQSEAFKSGYVEVPNMGGSLLETGDSEWWGGTLGSDVPIDVLRALKLAKEKDLFDEFRVFQPTRRGTRDPILVGVIGEVTFYVGSWH